MELDAGRRELTWLHLPGERFHDPFFEDTVRRHRRSAPSVKVALEVLNAASTSGSDPVAIFFHASRCGSSLLMQLLGRFAGCRAIAEPPVLDDLLHFPDATDAQISGLVRSFGKPDHGDPAKLFLKMDSWHLPHLDRIRRIFPDTPCYFIYREPQAILESHRRLRGGQMVPGVVAPDRIGIDLATVNPADLDGYAERVLGLIFRQAVAAVEAELIIPIAYPELPGLVWDKLGPAFGLPDDGWTDAKARAPYDAKHLSKVHEAMPLVAADGPFASELSSDFNRLETLRHQRRPLTP